MGGTRRTRRVAQVGDDKVLTEDEQKRIKHYLSGKQPSRKTGRIIDLDTVKTKRFILMIDLMIQTGMRVAEVVKLRVRDTPMVLGRNVVLIYRSKYNKDRTVQVSERLADKLTKYIEDVRPRTMAPHIKRSDINRPVFYSKIGKPYVVRDKDRRQRASVAIYRTVRDLGMHAGIKKNVHPHMFRHTFAVNTLLKGVTIYELQDLLGHGDIKITVKYLHTIASRLEGRGELLDSWKEGGETT